MKEPHIEGIATHDGPESCAGIREGAGEALTGESAGGVSSREINTSRVPTPFLEAEGNTDDAAIARQHPTRRGRRPPCTRGQSLHETREIPRFPAATGAAGRWVKANRPKTQKDDHGKSDGPMALTSHATWDFYGRSQELDNLTAILGRNRAFFAKLTGRRRIGKTSLVREALKRSGRTKVLYAQVPDSDPARVLATVRDFYDTFDVPGERPFDLRSLAQNVGRLVREGWVVALDEFQYFHRSALYEFTSHLQVVVDQLAAQAANVNGGLIVLGSVHTEIAALLEDRAAPLFNRITDDLPVSHLDIASDLEILRAHAEPTPERLLFLWNLFDGVPKPQRQAIRAAGCIPQDLTDLLAGL